MNGSPKGTNRCAYRNLLAWSEGVRLAEEVYTSTRGFPDIEKFGLQGQMRRSAISVPTNIAEGAGRVTPREFLRFLFISRGSLCELETLITLAANTGALTVEDEKAVSKQAARVSSLINGLIANVRSRLGT